MHYTLNRLASVATIRGGFTPPGHHHFSIIFVLTQESCRIELENITIIEYVVLCFYCISIEAGGAATGKWMENELYIIHITKGTAYNTKHLMDGHREEVLTRGDISGF